MKEFYQKPVTAIAKELSTNLEKGLSLQELPEREKTYGKNVISEGESVSIFALFIEQLKNPLVIILMIAVVLAAFAGKTFEAGLILSIVLFMAGIGVYLENNANKAVQKLKTLTSVEAHVIRNGKLQYVNSEEIYPGDILVLHDGDKVPADARIISCDDTQIDEALLTGESIPVKKNTDVIDKKVIVSEQHNTVFAGSYILEGHIKAVVIRTGMNTEIGKIAEKLQDEDSKETPMQKQLSQLGTILSVGTLLISVLVLTLTVLRGKSFVDGLIESLSLAIAFIPEGLSAVMTVVLAMGVKEMVQKKAIIKKLVAAEGMGSVTTLATDKTGTITEGRMKVEKLWMFDYEIDPKQFSPKTSAENTLIDIVRFCNNGKGATEQALVSFLEERGIPFELTERLKEHRFSSAIKRMTTIIQKDTKRHGYAKGAPDILIPLCTRYIAEHSELSIPLTEEIKSDILTKAESYARMGYRVLCLAYKVIHSEHDISNREIIEQDLTFVGLVALMDPLRAEVPETVAKLKAAGITPIMITGDHPAIALTIAQKAGIADKDDFVITGSQLQEYFDKPSAMLDIMNAKVFARVTPEHKQLLVDLLHKNNRIVAMAGDGINDAVAIKKSDIGIAVANATDIVKETADVIVTGSYDALANAVEIGRLIMVRTRLYLHYLLSGNASQIGIFILAILFNYPFPLTPVMLLIINLLTDAAPAMAMAFENGKGMNSVMKVPPKPPQEPIINTKMWSSIVIQAIVSSAVLFGVFYFVYQNDPSRLILAQTATFTAYIFQKLLRGFTARSLSESIFSYGVFTNSMLSISVLVGIAVWGSIVYLLPSVFSVTQLPVDLLPYLLGLAILMPLTEEFTKWMFYKKLK
jgi:Ca2+-transporting ATPase